MQASSEQGGEKKGIQNSPQNAIHREREMRIICVGAGPSGLCFAYKLQRSFRNFSLTLYEKNAEVSGTWFENTYPGCRCDFPSVNYTYTFEPRGNFTSVYAPASETHQYFKDFRTKYSLGKYCRLKHQVVGAQWNDDGSRWEVQVRNLVNGHTIHDSCDILINACGYLNAWCWPSIPGLKDFKGHLLHSADWNADVDLVDKTVGLIGNGSSAIQILPSIQPFVRKVTNVIRTPSWISPPFGPDPDVCSPDKDEEAVSKPDTLLTLRKSNENYINSLFPFVFADSPLQAGMRTAITLQMKQKLNAPHLESKLIPLYGVGARRLTPGRGYLESLSASNVEVVFGSCESVVEDGFVANEKAFSVDVLIFATGFDTSYKPRFPLIGLNGKNLQHEWASEARGYMSIAASGFPNYFMFAGPNSPVANGSLLPAIECQADYMLKFCNRWQTENITSFHPKAEAVEEFCAYTDQFVKKTVWDQDSQSWFRKGSVSGRNTALWPGSTLHFLEAMSNIRADDWHIEYQGNRFSWLGNGFSQTEILPGGDLSYYLRERDDSPFLGNAKRVIAGNSMDFGLYKSGVAVTSDRDKQILSRSE